MVYAPIPVTGIVKPSRSLFLNKVFK